MGETDRETMPGQEGAGGDDVSGTDADADTLPTMPAVPALTDLPERLRAAKWKPSSDGWVDPHRGLKAYRNEHGQTCFPSPARVYATDEAALIQAGYDREDAEKLEREAAREVEKAKRAAGELQAMAHLIATQKAHAERAMALAKANADAKAVREKINRMGG